MNINSLKIKCRILSRQQTCLNEISKFISRLYIGNSDAIDKDASKYFTKMNDSIGKVELPDRPTMNDTSAGKLAQTQFLSSTIKVCGIATEVVVRALISSKALGEYQGFSSMRENLKVHY